MLEIERNTSRQEQSWLSGHLVTCCGGTYACGNTHSVAGPICPWAEPKRNYNTLVCLQTAHTVYWIVIPIWVNLPITITSLQGKKHCLCCHCPRLLLVYFIVSDATSPDGTGMSPPTFNLVRRYPEEGFCLLSLLNNLAWSPLFQTINWCFL